MIDKELIYRKFKLISKDLKELRKLSYLSKKEYFENPVWEVQAERYIERILGRMIDINYHIITEMDNPPPPDYFESFVELGKLKVLSTGFAKEIAPFAGLRNRLVHEYNNLDEKKIYEAIKKIMNDIPRYLQYIESWMERKG